MPDEIENKIANVMQKDVRREYTIPEIMTGLDVKNREKVVGALARLEERGIVEVSRLKGRTKYYRLKEGGSA